MALVSRPVKEVDLEGSHSEAGAPLLTLQPLPAPSVLLEAENHFGKQVFQ